MNASRLARLEQNEPVKRTLQPRVLAGRGAVYWVPAKARWVFRYTDDYDRRVQISLPSGVHRHMHSEARAWAETFGQTGVRTAVDGAAVYYVQIAIPDGPIKIGFTNSLANRVRDLQTALPFDICLLARWPNGGLQMEQSVHARFAEARIRGEWFRPTITLLEHIEEVNRLYPRVVAP